jgi:hypothetical protein
MVAKEADAAGNNVAEDWFPATGRLIVEAAMGDMHFEVEFKIPAPPNRRAHMRGP